MTDSSLIRTLQTTIESQNETIEGFIEKLKKANENMEHLIKKLSRNYIEERQKRPLP